MSRPGHETERKSGARILRRSHRPRPASAHPSEPGSGVVLTRLSAALASPLSVLIVVPSLVLIVGLTLGYLADSALRGSNLEVARARLSDQAETVARTVRLTLGQAEPVLERLSGLSREHTPERDFGAFAHGLADLMRGRAGVTYISLSFPDGTFQGVYSTDAKQLEFQDSRLTDHGTRVRRYVVEQRPHLRFLGEEFTSYDPRKRGFYKHAVSAGKAVWTEPYPFFKTRVTGITRAAPLYRDTSDGGRELKAVMTVDYDVQAMSSFLSARKLPDVRAVLYSHGGDVLAYASDDAGTVPIPSEERTLRFADLADPVFSAFFAEAKAHGFARDAVARVMVAGDAYLAAVARASDDPELDWSVAYLAPESAFLRALHRYQRQSVTTSAIVLLVAFLVAWLFARHVTRVRREIEVAKAEVKRAQNEARDLGSYRLVSCLGKGGMGEVWRAEHRLLSREAAIKLIRTSEDGPSSGELKARFRREAQVLSSLRSRNTINLFDYGVTDDDTFFFVMELLDGMDLESLVNRHGAQPSARVIPLLIQACASLAEAHEAGLVHRDIKPANIFVCRAADERDVVKVLDFGLVRTVTQVGEVHAPIDLDDSALRVEGKLTMSGSAIGTPGFMSPEQVLGHEIDARADLYALGCVAVWLLSGRLLFEHENPLHRLVATITEDVPDLAPRMPDAPEALLSLLRALLSKKPEERPESARAMGLLLRAIPLDDTRWNDALSRAWWEQNVPRRDTVIEEPASARTLLVAK